METGDRVCQRDHRRAENVNGIGKTKSGRRAKVINVQSVNCNDIWLF